MTEDRSDAVRLGLLGACSGAIAWALLMISDKAGMQFRWTVFFEGIQFSPFSLYPGLVFGLIFGGLLRRRGKAEEIRLVGYVVASGLAYFCAYHVAHHTHESVLPPFDSGDRARLAISGILGGLVGSLLLGWLTMLLLRMPGRLLLRLLVAVGGAAGALLALIAHDESQWGWSFFALFALWQGAYAASLAPALLGLPRKTG